VPSTVGDRAEYVASQRRASVVVKRVRRGSIPVGVATSTRCARWTFSCDFATTGIHPVVVTDQAWSRRLWSRLVCHAVANEPYVLRASAAADKVGSTSSAAHMSAR